jgi:Taurine catabolism dioxygenase TauD, TfdA family
VVTEEASVDSDQRADEAWLLGVQRKLYQWSRNNPDSCYRELWNWVTDLRNLRCAWRKIAGNKGSRTAGIDGMTVPRIRNGEGSEAFLAKLRDDLRTGRDRPSPCRRKLIPKPGQPGKFRPLGIPTVADRVVLTRAKSHVLDRFAAFFTACSLRSGLGKCRERDDKRVRSAGKEKIMAITVCPVTAGFAAEIGDVDLSRPLAAEDVEAVKQAFWKYAVLIFPGQQLSEAQHAEFAKYFGPLETTIAALNLGAKLRLRTDLVDISNLNSRSEIWGADSRSRMFQLGNRLWHTDSSFKYLPARASLLYALTIPPVGGHTEFADLRAAYDALPDELKRKLTGLVAEHALGYSRARTGFTDFTEAERNNLPPVP